jgi:predicted enzyme related to lactoylglutathione lyase
VGPDDIPGIGRFAVIEDPFKALVAVMKPTPMEVKK